MFQLRTGSELENVIKKLKYVLQCILAFITCVINLTMKLYVEYSQYISPISLLKQGFILNKRNTEPRKRLEPKTKPLLVIENQDYSNITYSRFSNNCSPTSWFPKLFPLTTALFQPNPPPQVPLIKFHVFNFQHQAFFLCSAFNFQLSSFLKYHLQNIQK